MLHLGPVICLNYHKHEYCMIFGVEMLFILVAFESMK